MSARLSDFHSRNSSGQARQHIAKAETDLIPIEQLSRQIAKGVQFNEFYR